MFNEKNESLINDNYLKNTNFKLNDKILDMKDLVIEKMYLNNNINKDEVINELYKIKYKSFTKIYNIALSIQIGNWDVFLKMEKYLIQLDIININIYIVLIKDISTTNNINYIKNKYKNIVIIEAENKGMDIGLFLITLHYINEKKYYPDYIIKIHTKTNDEFRENVLMNLFGNKEILMNNLKNISKKNIGMVSGNNVFKYNEYKDVFESNYYYLNNIIKYLYNENTDNNYLEFIAGTFFICKYNIFNILNNNNIEYIYKNLNNYDSLDYYWYSIYYNMNINNKDMIYSDYMNNKDNRYPNNINYSIQTKKPGLRDYMLEHAIERLFGYICKKNNLDII